MIAVAVSLTTQMTPLPRYPGGVEIVTPRAVRLAGAVEAVCRDVTYRVVSGRLRIPAAGAAVAARVMAGVAEVTVVYPDGVPDSLEGS